MSKTTRNNMLFAMVPLLIVEGLMSYPVFFNHQPLWYLLAPISILTLAPIWGLRDVMESGSYGGFLAIITLDIAFVSIMAFSITKNHKVIGGLCLFVFIFLSVGFIAAGD
jgi:hypothetical protein